jgi:hypothetical protein
MPLQAPRISAALPRSTGCKLAAPPPVADPDMPRASLVTLLLSRSAYFADLLAKSAAQVVPTEHNQRN